MKRAGSTLVIGLIRAYQVLLSPWLGSACRFEPTCSEYLATAVAKYGPARGIWLGSRRIARCHPFHPGGLDPVP